MSQENQKQCKNGNAVISKQLDSDAKFYIIVITLYNIMKVEEILYVSILPIQSHNLMLYSGNNLGI